MTDYLVQCVLIVHMPTIRTATSTRPSFALWRAGIAAFCPVKDIRQDQAQFPPLLVRG